jgi:hypothetical protein
MPDNYTVATEDVDYYVVLYEHVPGRGEVEIKAQGPFTDVAPRKSTAA